MKKSTTPLFQPGDKVFYRPLDRYASVVHCINADDREDLEQQGPRYEISVHPGHTWSVLEKNLRPVTTTFK